MTKCSTCGAEQESTPGLHGTLAHMAHTGRELSEVMTVFLGHYDMALEKICQEHRARTDLERAREYAGRVADLVHRLQVVAGRRAAGAELIEAPVNGQPRRWRGIFLFGRARRAASVDPVLRRGILLA